MNYNYLALIQGGIGPDVWDKELKISAADFRDAASQAAAKAEELGGQVVELNQNDWNVPIEGSLTALRRTLSRLNEHVCISDLLAVLDKLSDRIESKQHSYSLAHSGMATHIFKTISDEIRGVATEMRSTANK